MRAKTLCYKLSKNEIFEKKYFFFLEISTIQKCSIFLVKKRFRDNGRSLHPPFAVLVKNTAETGVKKNQALKKSIFRPIPGPRSKNKLFKDLERTILRRKGVMRKNRVFGFS